MIQIKGKSFTFLENELAVEALEMENVAMHLVNNVLIETWSRIHVVNIRSEDEMFPFEEGLS